MYTKPIGLGKRYDTTDVGGRRMSKEFLNEMTKKELLEWAKVAYDEIQEYIEYCLKLKEAEE
jgi:hypothetical protein